MASQYHSSFSENGAVTFGKKITHRWYRYLNFEDIDFFVDMKTYLNA